MKHDEAADSGHGRTPLVAVREHRSRWLSAIDGLRKPHETKFARRATVGLVASVSLAFAMAPMESAFAATSTSTPRTLSVVITDTGFSPRHIVSVLGQPLTIRVSNQGTHVHEFAIPGYYIFTANMNPGTKTSVGFTPDKPGTFVFMSDPSGTDEPEFTGKLSITDAK